MIPAFLVRVEQPDRGGRWSQYFAEAREATRQRVAAAVAGSVSDARDEVTLSEFDPDGEIKVAASILYAQSSLPDDQLMAIARAMSADDRAALFSAYVGDRTNRRHKPGRAFERTHYRFDVTTAPFAIFSATGC